MKAFLALFATGWFFTLFLPWWALVVPGLVIGAWLVADARTALAAGSGGGAMAWMLQASIATLMNDGVLAGRVSSILFGTDAPMLLILATGLLGGLLGGSAALVGLQLKRALKR